MDITDETVGTTVMNLTNESVQEFGIQQSSLDVSTDLTSSGAVNILTKSGTNTCTVRVSDSSGALSLPPITRHHLRQRIVCGGYLRYQY